MISKGSLVRTRATPLDIPSGGIYLVITDPYEVVGCRLRIDILCKGKRRIIDIHNVEEVK